MDFLSQILAICGGISIVGGAGAFIFKVIQPAFKLSKRVEMIEKHQEADYRHLASIEHTQKVQSKALAALCNHFIDGNGIEKMKSIRDELTDELIKN